MAKSKNMSVDDFVANIYLPYSRLAKRSWQLDERVSRKYLSPVFGKLPLGRIMPQIAAKWFYSLPERGLAPATCNRILAVFRAILRYALRLGFLDADAYPCKNIKPLRAYSARRRLLSSEEAKDFLGSLRLEKEPAAFALRLLLLTGARKSEIIRARWENVDMERRVLFIPISKSGKSREILLSTEAMKVIRQLRQNSVGPWLFPGRKDKCLSDIYPFWNRFRLKKGYAGMRVHDLRHSFASLLVNSGHTLYETQLLLGHSNPRTTMRYATLATDRLKKIVDDLGLSLLGGVFEESKSPNFLKSIIGFIARRKKDALGWFARLSRRIAGRKKS